MVGMPEIRRRPQGMWTDTQHPSTAILFRLDLALLRLPRRCLLIKHQDPGALGAPVPTQGALIPGGGGGGVPGGGGGIPGGSVRGTYRSDCDCS